MSLFLYCSDTGLTWLREGKLPFLTASALMDPFVSGAPAKMPDSQAPVSDEELRAELKEQYMALPEALSSMMTFEYFREQALQKRDSIENHIRQRSQPEALTISELQKTTLTLLSVYERPDNPLLWRYHGDSHRGFVIELDQTHDFFTAKQYRDAPQIFMPVKYGPERPLRLKQTPPFAPLFYRSEQYSNEREWRVLRPAKGADKVVEVSSFRYYLHKVPSSIIKSVTLGALIEQTFKDKLLTMLKTDQRYKNVPLFETLVDPLQYQLHRIALKS